MDDKANTPANTGAEAPVSWNVRYVTAEGFAAQLTLRGASGGEVLTKAAVAVTYLVEHGAQPDGYRPAVATTAPPDPNAPDWCAIHGVQMKRHEKDGAFWYSHRLPDGSWCRGGKGQ
jgi:hypothetical protein